MAHFSGKTENCQQKRISVRPQNLIDFQGMAKRILSDTMNLYCFYIHHDPRQRQDLKGSWGGPYGEISPQGTTTRCASWDTPGFWNHPVGTPQIARGLGRDGRWPLTNLKALHLSEIANVEKKLTPAILVQAKNGPKRMCFPLRHGATFQRNIFVASPTARISGGADVVLRSWKEHDSLSRNFWFHAHILCFLNKHATIITAHLTYHPKEELFNKAYCYSKKRKAAILHTFTLTLPETWISPGWKTIQLPCMRSSNCSGACCCFLGRVTHWWYSHPPGQLRIWAT